MWKLLERKPLSRVLSVNVVISTHEEVSPLANEVRSWAWLSPGENCETRLEQIEKETTRILRRFPNSNEIARRYVGGKVCFTPLQRRTVFYPVLWVIGSVVRSDRVLLTSWYPPEGIDRLMWFVAFFCAVLFRRPIYLYSETWMLDGHAQAILYILRAKRAHRILFPAKVHGDFHESLGIQRVRLVQIESFHAPNPGVKPLIEQKKKTKKGEWVILYIGRIVPYKGLDRLIEIVHSLIERGYPVRLLIRAGLNDQYMGKDPGYPSMCLRRATELLGSHVNMLEPTEDVDSVYSQADVMVMPNRVVDDFIPVELWGRVVEEALFAGVPVISTNVVPASLELIRTGINGIIVPWERDDYLEDAIAGLMNQSA